MSEVFADTNILVRFLTNEPPDLAERAAELLIRAREERVDVLVPPIIIAETVHALHSVYKLPRLEVASRLLSLIDADVLIVLERGAIIQSLLWWRDIGGVDFPDAYLAALAEAARDARVVSLDRRMRRIPGIRLIEDPEHLTG